jgi:photosystem II stability/assembly factor-like uncharacterized protein
MRRFVISVFVVLGVFCFAVAVMAQEMFLVRIDIKSQEDITALAKSGTEVYAKTSKFYVAQVNQERMDLLSKEGISYQVLDDEPMPGLYYFVYARGNENIEPYLSQIKTKAEVMTWEGNWALIKGNRFKIEQLPALGFSIRKIFDRPLPLRVEKEVPLSLEALVPTYSPLINSMVSRVTAEETIGWVSRLSGEETVDIGGSDYVIATRYSYTEGCQKAGQYMKERLDSLGLTTGYHTFNLPTFGGYVMDVISTSDAQKAWAVGYGGVLKTVDAGSYWELVDGTEGYELWGVVAPHEDTLYAVGNYGIILKSTDSGTTWSELTIGTSASFRGAYFESPTCGWAVGDNGTILYTSTGGASWNVQSTPTSYRLYSMDFVDSNNGWVVGTYGTILNTTDRGTNWNAQSSGVSQNLYGLDFITSTKAWAVGENGRILYTVNAGVNWNTKASGTSQRLNAVCFVDSLHGWIAGFGGTILYTDDGGVNWEFRNTPYGYYPYGVYFADTQTGWTVGYYSIDFTANGGETWSSQFGNVEGLELKNVVATLPGLEGVSGEYLITGHYDNTSQDPMNTAPGADDNASGTAAVLAAASILRDYQFEHTVKFVVFPGEEQGLWGSYYYAQDAFNQGDNILGVLNFDMIAWDGNKDNVVEIHTGTDPSCIALGDVLIGTLSDYGINLVAQKITSGASGGSDHVSFWEFGYPAFLGIEDFDDFNAYYHTTGDVLAVVDTSYFVDYCKASVAALATLAGPYVMGDADGDGQIGLTDIVFLINYILKSGDPPVPLIAGDANCDGDVDLADVVYLINYVLKDGPAPCAEP